MNIKILVMLLIAWEMVAFLSLLTMWISDYKIVTIGRLFNILVGAFFVGFLIVPVTVGIIIGFKLNELPFLDKVIYKKTKFD